MSFVSEKYARALFLAARDAGELEDTKKAFAALAEQLRSSGRIDGGQVPAVLNGFLSVLSKKKRTALLFDVFDKFLQMCDEDSGQVRARISTAFPLDAGQKDAITEKLSGMLSSRVVLSEQIDPSLIAGAVLRVKDKVLDLSISGRLSELEKELAR